ncbi:Sulfide:quinone oxidoreductase, mitochondrial [Aphelenchoides besseyi]|nr:Sulfide:quinone oxidoreductase, mitochondrial [Aphelenchoides besseyi]
MKLSSVLCKEQFRLLICGGGTAGSAVAARFSRSLPAGQIAVVDGDPKHYYQPGYSLLGGGLIPAASIVREKQNCLPKSTKLFGQEVEEFRPKENTIVLKDGTEIDYEFLVVATGLQTRFDLIEGAEEALKQDGSGVCSIYRFDLAQRTYLELQKFTGGTAIFSFPNTPIKCPGAPQKICYMADEIFRKNGVRDKTRIIFNNTLGVIFEVEKYAKALMNVIEERGIELNTRDNLIKVDTKSRVATFQVVDSNRKPIDKFKEYKYDLLHIGPPCSPVESLRNAAKNGNPLTDNVGWVKVNEKSLQSTEFENVFALGDCANTTNKKDGSCSAQLRILNDNLLAAMKGRSFSSVQYDGYASCPLILDSKHVILSEFNHSGPLETLPINQAKPRRLYYWITRYFLLWLYWNLWINGRWTGPAPIRHLTGTYVGFFAKRRIATSNGSLRRQKAASRIPTEMVTRKVVEPIKTPKPATETQNCDVYSS